MSKQPFCQICRHPSPDHEPDCPVLTGKPQRGMPSIQQQFANAEQQQMLNNQLSSGLIDYAGLTYEDQFIGGPLDGPNWVHPAMNYKLNVEGHPEGYYEMLGDSKYHWINSPLEK